MKTESLLEKGNSDNQTFLISSLCKTNNPIPQNTSHKTMDTQINLKSLLPIFQKCVLFPFYKFSCERKSCEINLF